MIPPPPTLQKDNFPKMGAGGAKARKRKFFEPISFKKSNF